MKREKIYVEGMTLTEIARKYGLPRATVSWRYHGGGDRTIERLTRDKQNNVDEEYRKEIATDAGRRLLTAMLDKGLTVATISRITNINKCTIQEFIYGGSNMTCWRLAKICGVVGVSMDFVMGLRRDRGW